MRKSYRMIVLFIEVFMLVSCSKQKIIQEFEWEQVNPDVFMGNSSANHANGGMVCGNEREIYFSAGDENGYLYKMLPNGSEKELVLREPCYNINVIGNYIYYQNGRDHSIRKYCISSKESQILVNDFVEDMVVTSKEIYFISDTIEKIDLDGRERIQIMPEEEYFYLDVYGDYLFYTCIEDDINLYVVNNEGENPYLLLNGVKGAVVIEDRIFYTDNEDNKLYCYDVKNQKKLLIDLGFNANVWRDNIYYIKNDYLYCYTNGIYSIVLKDYFEQIIYDYELEAYYIVNDYMYIVYSLYIEEMEYQQMIALELTSDCNTRIN